MTDDARLGHDALRMALPECALGVLDGRERAAVMDHVEGCEECAGELAALTSAADSLVYLPVAADPPLGFETRVMDRIRASTAPPAPRHGALRWAAAAALVAGAFAVGWAVDHATAGPAHSTNAGGTLIERGLASGGRTVGAIWVDTGRARWMFVSLDLPGAPTTIRCEVVTISGQHRLVGTYELHSGYGAWGATLRVPWSTVHTVEITSLAGARLATMSGPSWGTPTTVTN